MKKCSIFLLSFLFSNVLIPAQSFCEESPATSLDQKDKELQAQEELLLKQVGGFKSDSPQQAQPQHAPTAAAAPQASALNPPGKVKVEKAERKEATGGTAEAQSAPQSVNCSTQELQSATSKIKRLQNELDEARNRLMISETEVERLSLLVDEQNRRTGRVIPAAQPSKFNGLRVRGASEIQTKAESDMPIATVISEKAQLRTGPGKDNSPLMTVPQGTRLAVETRNGDWYRVISPTGHRAWVSSDVIDFGVGATPDSASRGKGFSADAEDAAFEALAKGAKSPGDIQ